MSTTESTLATIEPTDVAAIDTETLEDLAAAESETAVAVAPAVPWKIIEAVDDDNRYRNVKYIQDQAIDLWMDDKGTYPRRYRSYSKDEWQEAIRAIADAVNGLEETAPEYQRTTGMYVEECTDNYLLIRGKRWNLVIQIPAKTTASSKRIEIIDPAGQSAYYNNSERPKQFADFVLEHVPEDRRDMVLDVAAQYLKDVRIYVNRRAWAAQNPDLAHLLDENKD